MQTTRKSLTTGFLFVAACLCFSQAKAPSDQWAHLFEGSPLLVAEDRAWIVQEPRVFSPGRVLAMEFGPGPNEAVAITVPRETITAESALTYGQAWSRKPGAGAKVSVFNLTNGSVKTSVLLPGTPSGQYLSWVSQGRLVQVDCQLSDGYAELVVDIVQGQYFRLPQDPGLMPVESMVPQLALYLKNESFGPPQAVRPANPKPQTCLLIDFSQKPPSTKAITLPEAVRNPQLLSSQGSLIFVSGKNSYGEYSLQDGSIRPFDQQKAIALMEQLPGTNQFQSLDLERLASGGYELRAIKVGARSSMPLSKEATEARLNAAESKAIFVAHGAGFVVDLNPIDLASAIKALFAQAKQKAMTNGKQAAIAAMIYGADYDDILPISGGQAKDALMPYLKNGEILDHVVWTNLTGQNVAGIKEPSQTELGYYPGPGGRAIIYADGHVVWKADP